jgi:antitoxin component of MazEF toxin-antitoxin module
MDIGRSKCISIPAEFAKELGIEAKEELYIDLAGNIVVVAKLERIKEKETINTVLKLLSDVIKISAKLDEEWKKYRRTKTSVSELFSSVDEAKNRLLEIGSSIEQLSREKVQPIKRKLNLKFIDSRVSASDIIEGVEALRTEAYQEALNGLCSEIGDMVEQRKAIAQALCDIDEVLQEYDQSAQENLMLMKLKFKQKMNMIDETLEKVKHLVQSV